MSTQNFLKAQRGDPDWAFTPELYFEKEFRIVNATELEITPWQTESVILRQNPSEKTLLAKRIDLEVRENAVLDLTILNEAADKLQQVLIYDIIIRDGGQLNLGLFIKGGTLNKHIINVNMENYSTFNAFGHVANHVGGDSELITRVAHQGACSNSHQFFTCESGDDSQTVFHGVTQIPDICQFTEASIEICNLVSGVNGRCHSVPDIYNHADSSKINCGTSTDFMDPERIYYLQTRGMSKAKAESILINSHRKKTFDLAATEDIRQEIYQLYN